MRNTTTHLLLLFIGLAVFAGCKKPKNNGVTLSAFAISLRNTCTTPFVGNGDSSHIYLATAFTPNGDGLNDLYGVQGASALSPGYFSSFLMKIYDTTGTLVFQSIGATVRWDGMDMTTGTQSTRYKFYVKINYTTAGNITDSGGTYLFLLSSNATRTCVTRVYTDTAKYEFVDQFDARTGFNPAWPGYENYCN